MAALIAEVSRGEAAALTVEWEASNDGELLGTIDSSGLKVTPFAVDAEPAVETEGVAGFEVAGVASLREG